MKVTLPYGEVIEKSTAEVYKYILFNILTEDEYIPLTAPKISEEVLEHLYGKTPNYAEVQQMGLEYVLPLLQQDHLVEKQSYIWVKYKDKQYYTLDAEERQAIERYIEENNLNGDMIKLYLGCGKKRSIKDAIDEGFSYVKGDAELLSHYFYQLTKSKLYVVTGYRRVAGIEKLF